MERDFGRRKRLDVHISTQLDPVMETNLVDRLKLINDDFIISTNYAIIVSNVPTSFTLLCFLHIFILGFINHMVTLLFLNLQLTNLCGYPFIN